MGSVVGLRPTEPREPVDDPPEGGRRIRRRLKTRWNADRAMVGWMRVSVSLYVLGFVVARFRSLSGESIGAGPTTYIGAATVLFGILYALDAIRRFVADSRVLIGLGDLDNVPRSPLVLAATTSAIGVTLFAFLIRSAQ